MPVLSLGDRKNGWFRSNGLSSIQTLSSFCQRVNRPSMRVASLMISAKGRNALAAGAEAPAFGADALAPDALAVRAAPGSGLGSTCCAATREVLAHPAATARRSGGAKRTRARRDVDEYFMGRLTERRLRSRLRASVLLPVKCDRVTGFCSL